jgi:DNA repair exonuclease SbcCD nuclease subunit
MSIGVVGISDVHLFHRRNLTIDIVSNLNKYFIPHLESGKVKLLLIAGDLFDRNLSFNHDDTCIADEWIYQLTNICIKHNIILRVLEGTPSHDWEQSKHFTKYSKHYTKANIKWINKISIEHIPEINKTILYVPDESTSSAEQTLSVVKDLLYSSNLQQVDIGCMHGYFNYQMPILDTISKSAHNEKEYLSIVKGPIIIGHIHTRKTKERIHPPGSFDRLAFNEEEDKGFLHFNIDEKDSSQYKCKFIVNKTAKLFKYIDGSVYSDLNALYEYLDSVVPNYPKNSYLSIRTIRKSFIDDNINDIQNRYSKYLKIEKSITDKKEHILATKEIIKDEYVSINITRNNISSLLRKRMTDSQENIEDIESCLAILNSIIND